MKKIQLTVVSPKRVKLTELSPEVEILCSWAPFQTDHTTVTLHLYAESLIAECEMFEATGLVFLN